MNDNDKDHLIREEYVMIECHKILSRIRWDKQFGAGKFKLGYLDRQSDQMVVVPFKDLFFPEGDSFSFQVTGPDGVTRNIPYHRVKEIYKDGIRIWHRSH